MAPEIVEKKEYDGTKCDIFALGVMMFILVQDNFPFITADISNDMYYKDLVDGNFDHYWNEVAEDNSLSAEFKDLFQKMVDYDPLKRPSFEEILKHPWMTNS